MHYLYLAGAIVAETIGTSALSQTAGFTRVTPTIIVGISFAISFYLMSLALQVIPVGIAYAIWAGAGIVLITIIGWAFLKQTLDAPALLGIGLILAGVVVLRVFSRAAVH
ncbi:DMT family transporter [Sphingosinicella soli]|uniref:Small multidrug resistance pump n=1 Tax=Sphingosinicella soli TaxID=333708 RepID=A0A7W7F9G4_9SPHN|nr:SMR family transporter [Sphingosinicella soli]MBB4632633.1 small multidrug resistance pump [Sphingosinicella soli]